MKLSDVINRPWLESGALVDRYRSVRPFPHIVLSDFINADLLNRVADEFPDLGSLGPATAKKFQNSREAKFASRGTGSLSPHGFLLNAYLQSDMFLNWLNVLTGINEPLISDPYLAGGGYHETRRGGFLKVHADFNKHPSLNLNRRLNLLIYLNKEWCADWGGGLQLFDERVSEAVVEVLPTFNTAVIFSTTSETFHGHPDPLNCPSNRSRRSLAYYYYSTASDDCATTPVGHSTLFRARPNERF